MRYHRLKQLHIFQSKPSCNPYLEYMEYALTTFSVPNGQQLSTIDTIHLIHITLKLLAHCGAVAKHSITNMKSRDYAPS